MYSSSFLRLINLFVPIHNTNSQSSLSESNLSLFIPMPEYAAASSKVKLLFSQIGTSFIKLASSENKKGLQNLQSSMYQYSFLLEFNFVHYFNNRIAHRFKCYIGGIAEILSVFVPKLLHCFTFRNRFDYLFIIP